MIIFCVASSLIFVSENIKSLSDSEIINPDASIIFKAIHGVTAVDLKISSSFICLRSSNSVGLIELIKQITYSLSHLPSLILRYC